MTEIAVRAVDVYAYRPGDPPDFLLFRRAEGVIYEGAWRMIGGKIERGEPAWRAALREIGEETGQTPQTLWTLPSTNTFYEWQADRVNVIPAFAAELDSDPVLDEEHDAFRWLPAKEAADRLQWPEQRRLLRLADEMLRGAVPPELHVPIENGKRS